MKFGVLMEEFHEMGVLRALLLVNNIGGLHVQISGEREVLLKQLLSMRTLILVLDQALWKDELSLEHLLLVQKHLLFQCHLFR
jgi:hypothetical protein